MQSQVSRPASRLILVAFTSFAAGLAACTGSASSVEDKPTDDGFNDDGAGSGGSGGQGGSAQDDEESPVEPGEGPTGFACSPTGAPPSVGMRRLTAVQYRNTLKDLLQQSVGDQSAAVFASLSKPLALYPADARQPVPQDKHGAYRRMDQDVQDLHVEAVYRVAFAAAEELVKPALLPALLGGCATDSNAQNDSECIKQFVAKFGARAFRRPLDADEEAFFHGFYGDAGGIDPKALIQTIAGILMAPRFLYMVEHGAEAVDGKRDVYALDDFELASRLSYQLWQTMPDDELYDAAAAGDLSKPESLQKQVDRMLKDPRAQATFDEFYADYLKLDDLPFIDKKEEFKYRSFAGSDLPVSSTRANVINDALAMTRYLTWNASAKWDELLLDEHVYATTDDVARLYKVGRWNGSGEPPKFPAGTRPGLLTRVAFLATGMVVTRPIMKGVFIRQNLLCDEIPAPPNNAQNTTITQGLATTRTMVERITQQEGSGCAACHSTLINPLGFATEGFDALGRARTEEIFYNGDTGLETRRFPVNTKVVPRITEDDDREAAGPADLARFIVQSKKGHACFARHLFRFTFGRWETLGDAGPAPVDGCTLERLRKASEDKPLQDVFREAALTPDFHQRTIKP